MTTSSASVYERVLGERFRRIDPGLRGYFGPLPEHTEGRGRGTFVMAGSRLRILWPVFAWMATRQILFPELAADVPFTVVNSATAHGSLHAMRVFHFPDRERVIRDEMAVVDGRLVDRLGRTGGLEVVLAVDVVDGGVRLRSTGLAIHLGRFRIPLPHAVRVAVDERFADGIQLVDVRLSSPVIGEVFRYSGSFTYAHTPIERR